MLISWSASGHGPVKDEEGASDTEEVTSINDKEASVLPEDSASNVGDDVAVPREEPTAMMIPPITSSITSDLGQRAPELPNGHSREVLPRTSPRV